VIRLPLAMLLVLATAGAVAAQTWTVGGPGADFPLIGPALAAASDGDVIVVNGGVYREDLVITRRVTLVGRGAAVLYGTGNGTVIRIVAPGSRVEGLVIEGSGAGETNEMDAAIQVSASGVRVVNNVMRRVFYGVVVSGASDVEIVGNHITGFRDLPFGKRGDGVYLYRAPRGRVVRNHIAGQRDGIYFQYAPDGRAEGNLVQQSRYGLHDMFSDGTVIRDNTFRHSSVGANIMDSRRIDVVGNRFESNRGASSVGLTLKQCDDSAVRDNVFADNARGLQLDGASNNRFVRNRFLYNDTGVLLFASAETNLFTENVFTANWSDVVVTGGDAGTRWSLNGRGNRWDRYAGFDFTGDGVGESAHPLLTPFTAIEGANPVARLFLQSPAATGLALAARLGIGSVASSADAAPLVEGPSPAGEPSPDRPGHRRAALGITILTVALAAGLFREISPCST
jgi:nitrous oxidase accessory protein